MSLPPVKINVELKEVQNLSRSMIRNASRPFLVGKIEGRCFGRSGVIAPGTRNVDLTTEPMPWIHEVVRDDHSSIKIFIELWDDRGDQRPRRLFRLRDRIRFPWTSGPINFGARTRILGEVTTTHLINPQTARCRRLVRRGIISATCRVIPALGVEYTDIRGLYKPVRVSGVRTSRHRGGYISADNQGRVFVNRDLAGTWVKDHQAIELAVKVTPWALAMPADAKIKWTVIDPDNPFDDAIKDSVHKPVGKNETCHREWGWYVDSKDYGPAPLHAPTGASEDDNVNAYSSAGPVARSKLYDQSPHPWEAVVGYTLSDETATEAKTAIDATGESKVKLHCPNVGGANFIVRAVVDTSASAELFPTETGVMTMWKRIDVEMVRMDGAISLAGAVRNIPEHMEPACVQLDFHPETTSLAAGPPLSPDTLSGGPNLSTAQTISWVDRAAVFTHKGDGGWFFLGAAKEPHILPVGGSTAPLFDQTSGYTIAPTALGENVDIPGSHSGADFLRFTWTATIGGTSRNLQVGFMIRSATVVGGRTVLSLYPNDVQNKFTGHDSRGQLDHAYRIFLDFFPTSTFDSGSRIGNGYNVPGGARLTVFPAGVAMLAGQSPSVSRRDPPPVGPFRNFFAGRTVLFTYHPAYSLPNPDPPPAARKIKRPDFDDEMVGTILHELTHAFGMPHKCGAYDYQTPRDKTCFMNYFNIWMVDNANNLLPGTEDKVGQDFCGRHLMEVRRVHLEDNIGLGW